MKNILAILLVLSFCTSLHAKKLTKKEKAIESLLNTIEVNEFVSHIAKIKKHKSIDEIKGMDYKLKKFFDNIRLWYFFDEVNFKKGFVKKLDKAFNKKELRKIKETFKKPFYLKVLNASVLHRDLFDYNKDSVDETFELPEIAKSRFTLVANMYNLYGMSIQKEELDERLKVIVKSGKVMLKVLGKTNKNRVFVDPIRLEKRLTNTRKFIIKYLAKDLKAFRHYELREFLRNFKLSRVNQRFLQLYANYHFLYMTKYINKVEKDKMNQLKAIEVLK